MITLSLLHPLKQIPVQVWTFENESVIRIGRSTDNHVILYSAVVSRHHVELRRVGANWEIMNLGTNGTYLDGKRITQVPIVDGAVIRLARSGPNIRIRMGSEAIQDAPLPSSGDRFITQQQAHTVSNTNVISRTSDIPDTSNEAQTGLENRKKSISQGFSTIPVPPHLKLSADTSHAHADLEVTASGEPLSTAIAAKPAYRLQSVDALTSVVCDHQRGGNLYCQDCGQPLHVLQVVGDYQLIKVLGQGDIGITYLAWRNGQNFVVKTLISEWASSPKAQAAFECEAEILRQISHPQIPGIIDFFAMNQQPYLVTELMPGQSLVQRILAEGPVPLTQAVRWILDVCMLLEYLHSFTPPILHRGIRPQSLIVQTKPYASGSLGLVDFGAIKALVLGRETPIGFKGYSAPEQLDINATPSVDLYALGPTLAYLVTGQNPIAFYVEQDHRLRFNAGAISGLTPALVDVIQTVTHPNPAQRYPSATVFAAALRQAI